MPEARKVRFKLLKILFGIYPERMPKLSDIHTFHDLFGFYPVQTDGYEEATLEKVFEQLFLVRRSAFYGGSHDNAERMRVHMFEMNTFDAMVLRASEFYPNLRPILECLEVPIAYQIPLQAY